MKITQIKRNQSLFHIIIDDVGVNRNNPKGIFLVVLYRIAHACVDLPTYLKPFGWIYIILYKIITEYIVGTEIHWRATIGPRLRIFHGYGLVVNSATRIGADCVLRHGVTIGVRLTEGDLSSPVLGNNVDVGASAVILGSVTIGDGCSIGAGTVVVKDVPAYSVAVGNPARIMNKRVL